MENAVKSGLVASLENSGSDVTGISTFTAQLGGKQLLAGL